jgi:hypothetical protein
MFTNHIRTKKSQVVEYNIIQMSTQNLVEVGSVCGPGEKKFFSMFFFLNFDLKKCVLLFLTTFVLRLFMNFSFSGSKKQKSQFFERFFVFSKFEPSGNFVFIITTGKPVC